MKEIFACVLLATLGLQTDCMAQTTYGPDDVESNGWVAKCKSIKAELRTRAYSDYVFTGSLNLADIGTSIVHAYGIPVGSNVEGESKTTVDYYDGGSSLAEIGSSNTRLIVSIQEMKYDDNFWMNEAFANTSRKIFGEKFYLAKHAYSAFEITTDNIRCQEQSRYSDAKKISLIDLKTKLRVRSDKIEAAFKSTFGDWIGYAYCFDDQQAVIDFSMTNEKYEVHGTTTAPVACKDLPVQKLEL